MLVIPSCHGQQLYENNHQLDCYNGKFNASTKGYKCSADDPTPSTCQSYLTFRAVPPYNSPVLISYLLGAQQSAPLIASFNNISSDTATIPTDSLVVIPVNCSCYEGQYYQYNTTYVLKSGDTYFRVANDTYQGLSTCQALMAQNPWDSHNLTVGIPLQVPLRCACPSPNQTAQGVKYLLSYVVTWADSVSSIAELFGGAGATEESTMYANQLSSGLIFPFTTLLIPLATEPTANTRIQVPPPPSPSPPQTPVVPTVRSSSSNSHRLVYVGVGIGIGVLLIVIAVSAFLFKRSRRKLQKPKPKTPTDSTAPPPMDSTTTTDTASSISKSWNFSSPGDVLNAIESLTVYKFQDLELATANFSLANKIRGSVYKGSFKGDAAAVKVMKGDVSQEINILKKINHSNIIRLSGFCIHQGNTYLVHEYAENGSLSDALHSRKCEPLAWKQRVHIAYGVADALNYLHNYTTPPCIHKNLKSSNILLDASLRAKVGNFGLARMLSEDDSQNGGVQLTRHVVGTQGYMAPEYVENGVITPKLDVFAFGVVLVELISGKEAAASNNRGEEESLTAGISRVLQGNNVRDKLRDFVDPCLRDEYPLELVFSMAELAKNCVAHDLNARPSMAQVFARLSKILSSSLDWDPSDELQRTSSLSH